MEVDTVLRDEDSLNIIFDGNPLFVPRILTKEEAKQGLDFFGKTDDYDSYAYLKIYVNEMNLTNIDIITEFKYLLFIDVSKNNLLLENLQILATMKYVILLQADDNHIQSLTLQEMEYLQVLLINNNYISTCKGLRQPLLNSLGLRNNKITTIEFDTPLENLYYLDLSYNLISSCSRLEFKLLNNLYLAGNRISNLEGLENLINLTVLHLRSNPIKKIDNFGSNLRKLKYLNLRSCLIKEKTEIRNLQVLTALETLIIQNCPIVSNLEEQDFYSMRTEIIAWLPKLQRLEKTAVTSDDRDAANELIALWVLEEEKEDEEEELDADDP